MLVGLSTALMVYQTFTPPNISSSFFVHLAGNTGDGTLAPAGTPCPIFSYSDNGWGGSFSDAVNIYKATVNWVPTTATMAIASAGSVACTAFNSGYNAQWNDVSQPGTTQKLDGIGGTLMFRAQWKPWNVSGYNSVVLNWGVLISNSQRSIKWCELHQDQSTGTWTMFQQGIYTPDADTRWLGSIAMDDYGSIGLCYMKSNSTSIYPGLYYTGRRSCDPLGTLPVTEVVASAGIASQPVGNSNRDGDYSETWLDPDGNTFWHTGMFMGAGGAQKTQIYSFQITPCSVTLPPVAVFSTADTNVCAYVPITFNDLSTNFTSSWSWSFPGGTPSTSTLENPVVTYTAGGTYSVTLTATNAVGSGTTTRTSYITIDPAPAIVAASSNSPVCTGQQIIFTSPTVAGVTYHWTGPLSYNTALQNPTRPASSVYVGGNYILTVTSGGCSSLPDTAVVVVNLTPTTPVITANTPLCVGATLTMTIPALAGATYNWTGPNSFTSSTQNQSIPSVTMAMAGTYSVIDTSSAGCFSSVGTKVGVVTATLPTPTITQNFGVLTSSAATGNQWYLNGTISAGATGNTYTMTQNGVYTVVVTSGGCTATSAATNVTHLGIDELTEANSLVIYP